MSKITDTVLVVGAGPTGLVAACELLKRGIPCRIIDKRLQRSTHTRALGINSASMMIFERMGIVDKFLERGLKMKNIEVFWNKKRFSKINYNYLKETKYPFILHLHQPETEKYLEELLESLGGKIERGVTLENLCERDNLVEVTLSHTNGLNEKISYSEVIGCDGGQSAVRNMLNIAFDGKDYDHHLIYCDAKLDWDGSDDKVLYYANQGHLLIIIPTPDNLYRIVGLVPGNKEARPEPTVEEMQDYLDTHGPGNIVLKDTTLFGSVPLYYRLAETSRKGRVFLAGDAFHLFSPLGGQGMNTGIQDAYNIAWKLAYVKHGFAERKLLDSYVEERHGLLKKVVNDIEKMINLLLRDDKDNDMMVKNLLPVFSNRKNFKHNFPRMFSGFNYQYETSNSTVVKYSNDFYALHEPRKHALLIFSKSESAMTSKIENYTNKYFKEQILIQKRKSNCEKIVLIRPDAYVAYEGSINDMGAFQLYIEQHFKKREAAC